MARAPAQSTREKQLTKEINAALKLARDAQNDRSYGPAKQALHLVSQLRAEQERLKAERLASTEADPIKRATRKARVAMEAGSYVAAASFERQVQALEEAARKAQEGVQDGLDAMTPDEIVEIVKAGIASLPDPLVMELRRACDDRLSGRKLRVV